MLDWNGTIMSKVFGKLRIKTSLETYITNTKEAFSWLSIKAPYVFLRFFCDSGLLQLR